MWRKTIVSWLEGIEELEPSVGVEGRDENFPENADMNFLENSSKNCLEWEADNYNHTNDSTGKWPPQLRSWTLTGAVTTTKWRGTTKTSDMSPCILILHILSHCGSSFFIMMRNWVQHWCLSQIKWSRNKKNFLVILVWDMVWLNCLSFLYFFAFLWWRIFLICLCYIFIIKKDIYQ